MTNEIVETDTVIGQAETYVYECEVATQTVVEYRDGPTTTIWTTIERFRTNGALTSYYQTTMVLGAYCHWPTPPAVDRPPPYTPPPPQCVDGCRPWWSDGGWTWTYPTATPQPPSHTRTTTRTRTTSPPIVITSVTVLPAPTSTRPRGPSSSTPVVITSITYLPPPPPPITTRCRGGEDCRSRAVMPPASRGVC